jgi:hypothetical protein
VAKGKYRHLRGKLPKFENPPAWQEKVMEAKKVYLTLDTTDLGQAMADFKNQKNTLEGQIKNINTVLEALSQLIVDRMEDNDMEAIELANGIKVGIKDEPYTSIEDQKKFYDWIKKTKQQGLLKINYQTLNAITKDLIINGKKNPPGTKTFIKTSAKVTGLKSTNGDNENGDSEG